MRFNTKSSDIERAGDFVMRQNEKAKAYTNVSYDNCGVTAVRLFEQRAPTSSATPVTPATTKSTALHKTPQKKANQPAAVTVTVAPTPIVVPQIVTPEPAPVVMTSIVDVELKARQAQLVNIVTRLGDEVFSCFYNGKYTKRQFVDYVGTCDYENLESVTNDLWKTVNEMNEVDAYRNVVYKLIEDCDDRVFTRLGYSRHQSYETVRSISTLSMLKIIEQRLESTAQDIKKADMTRAFQKQPAKTIAPPAPRTNKRRTSQGATLDQIFGRVPVKAAATLPILNENEIEVGRKEKFYVSSKPQVFTNPALAGRVQKLEAWVVAELHGVFTNQVKMTWPTKERMLDAIGKVRDEQMLPFILRCEAQMAAHAKQQHAAKATPQSKRPAIANAAQRAQTEQKYRSVAK